MNTRKGYRLLIVVLFFAFISLISRSIIYLVLSVAMATMILFLLSGAKKNEKVKTEKQQVSVVVEEQNNILSRFLWIVFMIGGLVLGYGSLFFTEETFIHQLIPMPDKFVAYMLVILGFCMILSSLYFLIKQFLYVGGSKTVQVIYCTFCGTKNDKKHSFCSSCGKPLS